MAFIHGRGQVVTIDGDALTGFSNSVTFSRTIDSHDVTCFGATGHAYQGGLTDGTASLEGVYDSTVGTGPGAILKALMAGGVAVPLVWRPEGTGSSKEEAEVDVLVTSFEQSAPVADMITWTAECQFSGTIDDTAQSA